jgi:hypothetical protein
MVVYLTLVIKMGACSIKVVPTWTASIQSSMA